MDHSEIDDACCWHTRDASTSRFHVVNQLLPPPLPLFERPFHEPFSKHAVELAMFPYSPILNSTTDEHIILIVYSKKTNSAFYPKIL